MNEKFGSYESPKIDVKNPEAMLASLANRVGVEAVGDPIKSTGPVKIDMDNFSLTDSPHVGFELMRFVMNNSQEGLSSESFSDKIYEGMSDRINEYSIENDLGLDKYKYVEISMFDFHNKVGILFSYINENDEVSGFFQPVMDDWSDFDGPYNAKFGAHRLDPEDLGLIDNIDDGSELGGDNLIAPPVRSSIKPVQSAPIPSQALERPRVQLQPNKPVTEVSGGKTITAIEKEKKYRDYVFGMIDKDTLVQQLSSIYMSEGKVFTAELLDDPKTHMTQIRFGEQSRNQISLADGKVLSFIIVKGRKKAIDLR